MGVQGMCNALCDWAGVSRLVTLVTELVNESL